MCGIAGFLQTQVSHPEDTETRLRAMADALAHRGPDDRGIFTSPGVRCGLVNTRLAIRDLSLSAHMPMETADSRFCITFNGEIYNATSLRRELRDAGCAFRSTGDTEVVLEGFRVWGDGVVQRLSGIFALAIWDDQHKKLLLARDRFGVKPLYVAETSTGFFFASEVRALLASGAIQAIADPIATEGFLMLGSVPAPRTIVSGIESFPPAHLEERKSGTACFKRREFWSRRNEVNDNERIAISDLASLSRQELTAATKAQVVSDAPLGLFLSGGIDSSALAALMRSFSAAKIKSVSIGFDDANLDESSDARRVAQRFGFEHFEERLSAANVSAEFPNFMTAMDQPTCDGINTYFVSKAARNAGLKVALSGLGADELFGGYKSFRIVPKLANILRVFDVPTAISTGHAILQTGLPLPYSTRKLVEWSDIGSSRPGAYALLRGLLSPHQTKRLLQRRVTFNPVGYLNQLGTDDALCDPSWISDVECRTYLMNQLLRDTDVFGMTHSLEIRVPFLDDRTVALAAATKHIWSNEAKAPITAARSLYFPDRSGPKSKQGFTFPLAKWLTSDLSPLIADEIESTQFLNRAVLRQLTSDLKKGRCHWSHVWAPIVLDRWLRINNVAANTETSG